MTKGLPSEVLRGSGGSSSIRNSHKNKKLDPNGMQCGHTVVRAMNWEIRIYWAHGDGEYVLLPKVL